jgi:hypothetical protein
LEATATMLRAMPRPSSAPVVEAKAAEFTNSSGWLERNAPRQQSEVQVPARIPTGAIWARRQSRYSVRCSWRWLARRPHRRRQKRCRSSWLARCPTARPRPPRELPRPASWRGQRKHSASRRRRKLLWYRARSSRRRRTSARAWGKARSRCRPSFPRCSRQFRRKCGRPRAQSHRATRGWPSLRGARAHWRGAEHGHNGGSGAEHCHNGGSRYP